MQNFIPLIRQKATTVGDQSNPPEQIDVFLPDPNKFKGVPGTETTFGDFAKGVKSFRLFSDAQGNQFQLNPAPFGGITQPTASFQQISGSPISGSTTEDPTEFLRTHRDLSPNEVPIGRSFQGFQGNTPLFDPSKEMTAEKLQAMLSTGSVPNDKNVFEQSSGSKMGSRFSGFQGDTTGQSSSSGNVDLPFPNVGSPPTFDLAGEEARLRGQFGYDTLTSQLNSVDSQIQKLQNDFLNEQDTIQGTPTSTRFQSRAISKERIAANKQLRELTLQRSDLTRRLSVATKSIAMTMRAEETDFKTAQQLYEFKVNRNIQAINLFDRQAKADEVHGRANLTYLFNLLGSGKLKYDDLTDNQKASLESEISRLMPGFEDLPQEIRPGKPALYHKTFTQDGKQYLYTARENPDGTLSGEYITPLPGQTASEENKSDISSIASQLQERVGNDGRVSPSDWNIAKNAWVRAGNSAATFDKIFSNFTPGDLLNQ